MTRVAHLSFSKTSSDVFGYSVMVGTDSDGNKVVEATDKETGERFVVRADDLHMAAVELAQQVGIDLSDG